MDTPLQEVAREPLIIHDELLDHLESIFLRHAKPIQPGELGRCERMEAVHLVESKIEHILRFAGILQETDSGQLHRFR